MTNRSRSNVAALALLFVGPPLLAQEVNVDWDQVADVLMERMDLQPAERVLLVGRSGHFDPLVAALRARIVAVGAADLGAIDESGRGFEADLPTVFTRELAGLEGPELVQAVRNVDVGVMLPGATPADPVYRALQHVLGRDQGRTVHFHWAGAYGFDGVLLDLDDNINDTYVSVLTNTDYEALASTQRAFERAARQASIHVSTPAGTDLSFRIGTRPVTKQDGDASMAHAQNAVTLIDREIELPAGAIRVAPIEESVSGTIAFPPTVWGSTTVQGLVLTIENGRVVGIEAESGVEAVTLEMDEAGPAARAFREFALGMNPLLAIPPGEPKWIPYYGYGAGVVRLSLGDNTELGGNVTGGYVRWNFFTDATVTVGSDVWVQDGRLVR